MECVRKMKKTKILIGAIFSIALLAILMLGYLQVPNTVVTTSVQAESKNETIEKLAILRNKELNKNLVPDKAVNDEIACSIFLRFVKEGYRNPQEREMRKRYLSFAGFKNPADQEKLLQHAERFVSASNQLEITSRQYKQNGNRNNDALRKMSNDKSKLVKDVVRDLQSNLSSDGWSGFNEAVLNRIKPRIKVSRTRN